MLNTEQMERERRASIHRWFVDNVYVDLMAWQLNIIVEKLNISSKIPEPEPATARVDDVKSFNSSDDGYEQWKSYHERWVREQNTAAFEGEAKLASTILRSNRSPSWWVYPQNYAAGWRHTCYNSEDWINSEIAERCIRCGVERPQTQQTGTFGWWVDPGHHGRGWGHNCVVRGAYQGDPILLETYDKCNFCGVERPQA